MPLDLDAELFEELRRIERATSDEPRRLTAQLVALMRRLDLVSGLDPRRNAGNSAAFEAHRALLWIEVTRLGRKLNERGGQALMHAAVREVRRDSARLADAVESSWRAHIPGYQPLPSGLPD